MLSKKEIDQIDLLLENLETDKSSRRCLFNQTVDAENGYRVRFYDGDGYPRILIIKDDFYWLVRPRYNGNFYYCKDKINIFDYVHQETNGSFEQVVDALKNAAQYFPKKHFRKYEMDQDNRIVNPNRLHGVLSKIMQVPIFHMNGFRQDQHFYHRNLTKEKVEELKRQLKKAYPALTIKDYIGEENGISLLESEIPALLTALDKPKKESRAAINQGTTKDSLKWLTSKSIWKILPQKKIKEFMQDMPDLKDTLIKAKKFV